MYSRGQCGQGTRGTRLGETRIERGESLDEVPLGTPDPQSHFFTGVEGIVLSSGVVHRDNTNVVDVGAYPRADGEGGGFSHGGFGASFFPSASQSFVETQAATGVERLVHRGDDGVAARGFRQERERRVGQGNNRHALSVLCVHGWGHTVYMPSLVDSSDISPAFRSGLFSLFFSPIALSVLGSSMANVQGKAALGLPLASVEGMVGMGLAALIMMTVSLNCDRHPAGMFVAAVWSVIIGALQCAGLMRIPFLVSSGLGAESMASAQLWCLYPLSVTAILCGASLALVMTHRARTVEREGEDPHATSRRHLRSRALVVGAVFPLAAVAMLIIMSSAPSDTTAVAAYGLPGVVATHRSDLSVLLLAAVLLCIVAMLSHWSLLGPQLIGWGAMAMPFYVLFPLWATLAGLVITPGASMYTQIGLSAPVLAALGMLMATSTAGIRWARRTPPEEREEIPAPIPS